MPHVPGDAPLRRADASFANHVVVATMSSGARRCGNDVVGAGPAVSWSKLCGPARPRDHTFSVAWMTSRRTGGVVAQLARPALGDRGAQRSGRRPVADGSLQLEHGSPWRSCRSPDPFPVIATLLWKRQGHTILLVPVRRRRGRHRQQHWPHRSQINGGFDGQAAGSVAPAPSSGPCVPLAPERPRFTGGAPAADLSDWG